MKHLNIFCISLALLTALPLAAQKKKNVLDIAETITDEAVIFPESFETDTRKLLEGWYMSHYTMTDDSYATKADPGATDAQMRDRLAALPTVIDLPFNQIVRSCIERYTRSGRSLVASQLGLANYYMPIFEQTLEEEGLPLELKYLPVIESALDPTATSRSGAAGLWQFMIAAAKGYDLEVNSLVDERRDTYLSTRKAAQLLKDLYNTYGDWSLAIAAYNCGPGNVNKAIRRAGGDPESHNFWTIYNYLPRETRGYFPMFIAANYVMNYYREHNISPVLPTKPLVTDTVAVNHRVHFDQISRVLDIPVDELRVLNPQFRADIIPASAERTYYVVLPSQQVHAFIMSESQIYDYEADKYARQVVAEPGQAIIDEVETAEVIDLPSDPSAPEAPLFDDYTPALAAHPDIEPDDETPAVAAAPAQTQQSQTADANTNTKVVMHKVKADETLASIATKYGVTPAKIKEWNGLRRNAVRTGQQLKIYAANTAAAAPAKQQQAATQQPAKQQQQTAQAPAKQQNKQQGAAPQKQQTHKPAKKKAEPAQPSNHKIKDGESLSTIARKYGTTVEELKKANNMKDDNIRAGKDLKIPAKASKSSKKSSKGSGSKSGSKKSKKGKKGKKK